MTLHNHPSFVGFDRLFDQLDRLNQTKQQVSYPPHNIVKVDDHEYVLELALAGYSQDDIEIELEKGVMTVRTKDGYSPTDDEGVTFLHKGISAKRFRKSFTLSENMQVEGATMVNGILNISLLEVIPEEEKPKLIPIGGGQQLLTE
jgi:molecular chaperone IbpA